MSPSIPDTILHRLVERARCAPSAPAYWYRSESGWTSESWGTVLERVRNLSAVMIGMGVCPGDRVALMLPTGPAWEYCHLAALAAGATVVGLDEHDADENIRHAMSQCAPVSLLVHTGRMVTLLASLAEHPRNALIVDSGQPLSHLVAQRPKPGDLPEAWPLANEDLTATIVFSSGSTGRPKGLGYTHRQMCLAADAILAAFPAFGSDRRLVCWLPLSNLFQRVIDLCALSCGAQVWFVEKPTEIALRLPEIRPDVFIAVPRFYEKLYAGIQQKIARSPLPVRLAIRGAWRVALFRTRKLRRGKPVGSLAEIAYRIADSFVLARVRAATLGGRIELLISGSAPFPAWLLEQLEGLGWAVLEAYGVSENIVPIALNTPDAHRLGSVGRALPPNEVRLADDGELLVRSAGISAACARLAGGESPVSADGFLHTGDLATVDQDGYIWLIGRKSEIFKTSTGRRVAPVPIENSLKALPYVEHAVVFGSARPVPVALLSVDLELLGAREQTHDEWSASAIARITADIGSACAGLASHERPAGVLVTSRTFTIADGDLTSNLKLRRKTIEERYGNALDTLYTSIAERETGSDVLVVAV